MASSVLAQERRAHAEAAEASERVKALEAALQQSKAVALAAHSLLALLNVRLERTHTLVGVAEGVRVFREAIRQLLVLDSPGLVTDFLPPLLSAYQDQAMELAALKSDMVTRTRWLASPRASAYSVRRSDSSWWPADLDSAD
jgi:hypothetical protein